MSQEQTSRTLEQSISGLGHEPRGVQLMDDGTLRIGATERLGELAKDELLDSRHSMLAAACAEAAAGALSESATLGGSLVERPRCPVFRRKEACFRNGGSSCPAEQFENDSLAIIEGGPCWAPHPSSPAVALVALDAMFDIAGPTGSRSVAAAKFFVLPAERLDREVALAYGEFIVAVRVPSSSAGGLQRFAMALHPDTNHGVTIAAARRSDGEVRMVLGGVSPRPYRIYSSVEEEANTGPLDDETIDGLAERALLDAVPLSKNGYKLELATALLRDAIRAIANTAEH